MLLVLMLVLFGYAVACIVSGTVYGLHGEWVYNERIGYSGAADNLGWFERFARYAAIAVMLIGFAILVRGAGRGAEKLKFLPAWAFVLGIMAAVGVAVYVVAGVTELRNVHEASAATDGGMVFVSPVYVVTAAWHAMFFAGCFIMLASLIYSAVRDKGIEIQILSALACVALLILLAPAIRLVFTATDIMNYFITFRPHTGAIIYLALYLIVVSLILTGIASLTRLLLTSRPSTDQ